MSSVRVYAYNNDGRVSMCVLTNSDLFDRYEKFLSYERQVRYDYVEADISEMSWDANDNEWVVAELEDFGY